MVLDAPRDRIVSGKNIRALLPPAAMRFGIGQKVRLSSGGPDMLVVDFVLQHQVICAWVLANGKTVEASIPAGCLVEAAE